MKLLDEQHNQTTAYKVQRISSCIWLVMQGNYLFMSSSIIVEKCESHSLLDSSIYLFTKTFLCKNDKVANQVLKKGEISKKIISMTLLI